MQTFCGSQIYMPPEIVDGRGYHQYTKAVDIWSLGVVILKFACGLPYPCDGSGVDWCRKIAEYARNYNATDGLFTILKPMLMMDQESRPSAAYCFNTSKMLMQSLDLIPIATPIAYTIGPSALASASREPTTTYKPQAPLRPAQSVQEVEPQQAKGGKEPREKCEELAYRKFKIAYIPAKGAINATHLIKLGDVTPRQFKAYITNHSLWTYKRAGYPPFSGTYIKLDDALQLRAWFNLDRRPVEQIKRILVQESGGAGPASTHEGASKGKE
ncbi:hypothetical protein GGR58DRAFT_454934 [Xylaria digitata]|nr:hypothetical protein GGR58DRAFT_454934 [Xylaria digitata]